MSQLFNDSLAWGDDGPSYFDLAMAIVTQNVQQLDDRRRDRFAARLQKWAESNPPDSARMASAATAAGDRFVAAMTSVARRAVHNRFVEPDDRQSLFCEGVLMGMQRLVKYWGPGKRYPQRCPVHYSIQAVKSGCSNAIRKHRREMNSNEPEGNDGQS